MGCVLITVAGCGEDKGYGDPIDNAQAEMSAGMAVGSAGQMNSLAANDTPLNALNTVSAHLNVMVNAKYQAQFQEQPAADSARSNLVDEACVVISGGDVTYNDCDFGGGTIAGSVSVGEDWVTADLAMTVDNPENQVYVTTDMSADLTVRTDLVSGSVDYKIHTETDDVTIDSDLLSDFDVDLDGEGCAVGGEIEAHAIVVSRTDQFTATQDLWVKANFGPACGDVVIR